MRQVPRLANVGFGIAIFFFLLSLLAWQMEVWNIVGIFLCVGLVITAFSMLGRAPLKGYAFTVLILATVSTALFFPFLFQSIGTFSLKRLILPLLMVIMFGMGTSMRFKDFVGVLRMPKGVLIGLICQFSIMPFLGFGLASISGVPPEIAAGIILVGCSPSGLASNVMAYLANANLALSLTLTMIATLLAPIFTPFLMQLLANQLVPIDFWAMMLSIMKIVIIPVLLGLLFNTFVKGKLARIKEFMPLVSMGGIALIIAIITAAGRDSMLSIGILLVLVVIVHNVCGYGLGYGLSRLLGMDEASARTIAFEVGMQNSGLASGIALEMGRLATMGLAPALFGPFMNVSGSLLATYWRKRKGRTPHSVAPSTS